MIIFFLTLTNLAHLLPLAIALSVDVTQGRKQTLSDRGLVRHSVGPLTIECDGDKYGENIQLSSCHQAFAQLSQDPREHTWGPHGSHMELITPHRILSRE